MIKETLITKLRNKETTQAEFREATHLLALLLASEAVATLETVPHKVTTPLGVAEGAVLKRNVVLVPILRSGLVLLAPFLELLPHAKVGMLGLKRDEETAIARGYYTSLPEITGEEEIFVLDPMLATGGSAVKAIEILIAAGAKEERITGVFVISAPEGISALKTHYPKVRCIIAQQDQYLTPHKYIFPGLGDFGDRFYGTLP